MLETPSASSGCPRNENHLNGSLICIAASIFYLSPPSSYPSALLVPSVVHNDNHLLHRSWPQSWPCWTRSAQNFLSSAPCGSSRKSQPRCWLHHFSLQAVKMGSMQLVAHPDSILQARSHSRDAGCIAFSPPLVAMRCRQLAAHPYLHQAGNRSLDAGCITFPHHCGNAFQAARRTLQSPSSRQEVPAAMSLHHLHHQLWRCVVHILSLLHCSLDLYLVAISVCGQAQLLLEQRSPLQTSLLCLSCRSGGSICSFSAL